MQNKIRSIISEAIDNVIAEKALRREVETIVEEKLKTILMDRIFEAINEEDDEEMNNDKKRYSNKYKSVMRSLKDDGINKADLMRSLWHPKDQSEEDTGRSLFSKKANGKPDADGAIRKFTPTEVNKLYDLIRSLGK